MTGIWAEAKKVEGLLLQILLEAMFNVVYSICMSSDTYLSNIYNTFNITHCFHLC